MVGNEASYSYFRSGIITVITRSVGGSWESLTTFYNILGPITEGFYNDSGTLIAFSIIIYFIKGFGDRFDGDIAYSSTTVIAFKASSIGGSDNIVSTRSTSKASSVGGSIALSSSSIPILYISTSYS